MTNEADKRREGAPDLEPAVEQDEPDKDQGDKLEHQDKAAGTG